MSTPTIRLSDAARQAIERAAAGQEAHALRLTIGDQFDHSMQFDTPRETDVRVPLGAVELLLDPATAGRANGLAIDYVTRPEGAGFVVDNPNQPKVRAMTPHELKLLMESGREFVLVDVRTEQERAVAKIEGSRLLDEESYPEIIGLDRSAAIVFQCHHGIRSQAAAEHFLHEGFRNVFNLEGGIDAWSQLVDPRVPRY